MELAALIFVICLSVAVITPFIVMRRSWLSIGIFHWHHHNGQMRRKLRDGRFEYRQETPSESIDQIDKSAW